MADLYRCNLCCLSFKAATALANHNNFIHGIKNSWKCEYCEEVFSTKRNLVHHKSECKPCKLVVCPLCRIHLTRRSVCEHFKVSHDIAVEQETLHFQSLDDFKKWKKEIELETTSSFVNRRGENKTKCGLSRTYVCHRNGNFVSKGKNKRNLKAAGSNKINGHCPAKLIMKTSTDGVTVVFVKTHVGHLMDLKRISLSKEEKDEIAKKIAAKIPLGEVLDQIRDTLDEETLKRQHLITRKDLHNIVKTYNLHDQAVLESNNTVNVDDWIEQMRETTNLIRLYKPQGNMLEEYPELNVDDFFLVLANDSQLNMLTTYGNNCICIDSTKGIDSCDFQLFTVLVLDDLCQGFPTAFLLSNREDMVAMQVFFSVLKQALVSPIEPRYFLTDSVDTIFLAWCCVMPHTNTCRFICNWHLEKMWRANLNKIKGKENQVEVYKQLRAVVEENDVQTFEIMKRRLLEELYSVADYVDFARYIETFFSDPSPWAYCFRKNASVDINMVLENMHKVLKHLYLMIKKVKRLDKNIHALMHFLRGKFYDRFITLHKEKVTCKLSDLNFRHRASLALPRSKVIEVDGVWTVPSSTNLCERYEVKVNDRCCKCDLRCSECGVCIHFYSCTCVDYSIKWNMCEHAHLVAQISKENFFHEETIDYYDWGSNESFQEYGQIKKEHDIIIHLVEPNSEETISESKRQLQEKMNHILNLLETEEQAEAILKILVSGEQILEKMKKARKDCSASSSQDEPATERIVFVSIRKRIV